MIDLFIYLFTIEFTSFQDPHNLLSFAHDEYLLIGNIDVLFLFQALLVVAEPYCSTAIMLCVIPNENKAIAMEKPVVFMLFLPQTASSKWLKRSSLYVVLGVKVK